MVIIGPCQAPYSSILDCTFVINSVDATIVILFKWNMCYLIPVYINLEYIEALLCISVMTSVAVYLYHIVGFEE